MTLLTHGHFTPLQPLTWWIILPSKWVISLVISGSTPLIPLISGYIINRLTKWDDPPSNRFHPETTHPFKTHLHGVVAAAQHQADAEGRDEGAEAEEEVETSIQREIMGKLGEN